MKRHIAKLLFMLVGLVVCFSCSDNEQVSSNVIGVTTPKYSLTNKVGASLNVSIKALKPVDAEGKALTKLMAAILNERRKEFFAEGDRMFELKRNGAPEYYVLYNGLRYNNLKYMYTFPLPESDIRINPQIIQNEGYKEVISN